MNSLSLWRFIIVQLHSILVSTKIYLKDQGINWTSMSIGLWVTSDYSLFARTRANQMSRLRFLRHACSSTSAQHVNGYDLHRVLAALVFNKKPWSQLNSVIVTVCDRTFPLVQHHALLCLPGRRRCIWPVIPLPRHLCFCFLHCNTDDIILHTSLQLSNKK